MIENTIVKNENKGTQHGIAELRVAQNTFSHDRKLGFEELNQLLRSGTVLEPSLNGRYAGKLIALDLAPVLTRLFEWLINRWLPWHGKTFNAAHQSGDNIFTQDSYSLARFFNPFYHSFVVEPSDTYRCFNFHSYVATGLADPDRSVLKIDYDIAGNPSPTIRRILDELVQLDRNLYLGKAHVHWWLGGWQTIAYFLLKGNQDEIIVS